MSVDFVQSGGIAIDDPHDFARFLVVEIPNEVRPPLASPNHRHANHCHPWHRRLGLPNAPMRGTRKSRSAPRHHCANRSELLRLRTIFTVSLLRPEYAGDG